MRPLNRPMFRYGGPIKEGIMDGMKTKAALVGDPVYPTGPDGRSKHAAVMALPYIGTALRFLGRPLFTAGANIFRQATQKGGKKLLTDPKFQKNVAGKYSPVEQVFDPNKLVPTKFGKYLLQSPEGRLITGGAGFAGKVGKKVIGAGKYLASSPLTVGSAAVYGGKSLYNALTGEKEPEVQKEIEAAGGPPGGGDPNMFARPKEKVVNQEDLTKDRIQKTKERYYKLMGLDDMKKDAVYDSLIDASKIVQEEGADLKGAIKSGTLQNRIIQAISGQLDKSAALKKQIDAAVLKGEIEKDIAGAKPGSYLKQAEDYAAMKGVSVSQAYQDLGFDKRGDLNEGVQLYLKTNKVAPAGNDLATLARSYEIDIAGIEDTTTVKNKMKEKGYDEVGYLNEILSNPNAQVTPGNYVINNRVLNVDADKNITPVF